METVRTHIVAALLRVGRYYAPATGGSAEQGVGAVCLPGMLVVQVYRASNVPPADNTPHIVGVWRVREGEGATPSMETVYTAHKGSPRST